MIVWGGFDVLGYSTCARYYPFTDTWMATATDGEPSARSGHTAVWTGRWMIIWGGSRNEIGMDTGGRYDLARDMWVATSTTDAPSPRYRHTSLWTGNEMIVWGGGPGRGTGSNTGGRYCVSSCDSPSTWYQDRDGDGYGTIAVQLPACEQPTGFAGLSGDNCPAVPNADQADFDTDGLGDVCETGARLADADLSGRADGFDLAQLARSFGANAGSSSRYNPSVDFDHDLEVGPDDLTYLANYFGQLCK